MAYEMHQYLDSDGSGTSETCVSSTIGKERLEAATSWLQENGKKGFLGEIGAGSNDDCITAVQGALCSMQQAGGVWIGALWWAAGPWCKSPLLSSGMPFIDVNTAQGVLTTNRSSHPVVRPLKEFCRRRFCHSLSSYNIEGNGGNWMRVLVRWVEQKEFPASEGCLYSLCNKASIVCDQLRSSIQKRVKNLFVARRVGLKRGKNVNRTKGQPINLRTSVIFLCKVLLSIL
jgi:hypothetical protein